MVEFKVNVGDPDSKKTFPVTVSGAHANVLVRKKIGDEVDGMFLGLPGYKVTITGGSDKDGFPMRPEIPGAARKRILVTESVGFHPDNGGVRRKKSFRGQEIGPNILQINCRITQKGPKPVDELLGKKE
jgi:small subunit ribosomal protein S6e